MHKNQTFTIIILQFFFLFHLKFEQLKFLKNLMFMQIDSQVMQGNP